MAIISNWLLKIIIFIMIATIIDALLPENKMKQYVYLVFGFILFLIFTQPILYLFSIDINKEINRVELFIDTFENEQIPTSITYELQKNEIESEQRAYILEQAKNTLINEANPILENEYQIEIIDLEIHFKDDLHDEEVDRYEVFIIHQGEEKEQEIEPIIISTKKDIPENKDPIQTKLIQKTLSQIWGIQEEVINVYWEENE